ncbi:MAG: hypothetical protein HQM09_07135 [Candidatus Riflebacteria bacterium]|nr:hypothetical protein [Candidatus Riflebacteria bacterium]
MYISSKSNKIIRNLLGLIVVALMIVPLTARVGLAEVLKNTTPEKGVRVGKIGAYLKGLPSQHHSRRITEQSNKQIITMEPIKPIIGLPLTTPDEHINSKEINVGSGSGRVGLNAIPARKPQSDPYIERLAELLKKSHEVRLSGETPTKVSAKVPTKASANAPTIVLTTATIKAPVKVSTKVSQSDPYNERLAALLKKYQEKKLPDTGVVDAPRIDLPGNIRKNPVLPERITISVPDNDVATHSAIETKTQEEINPEFAKSILNPKHTEKFKGIGFANHRGALGVFKTASAFGSADPQWSLGVHARYDHFKYLDGKSGVINGNRWLYPISLVYSGDKLMAGIVMPFQSWTVGSEKQSNTGSVSLSDYQDPELRLSYQTWKSRNSENAIAVYVSGKMSGGAYHQPLSLFEGKSTVGSTRIGPLNVGPAWSTRGGWMEFGGGYSGCEKGSRWAYDLNLGYARDSQDDYSKVVFSSAIKYRTSDDWTVFGEISGESWRGQGTGNRTNIDLTPGLMLSDCNWRAYLGVPVSLSREFGFGHDYGVICGLSTSW